MIIIDQRMTISRIDLGDLAVEPAAAATGTAFDQVNILRRKNDRMKNTHDIHQTAARLAIDYPFALFIAVHRR